MAAAQAVQLVAIQRPEPAPRGKHGSRAGKRPPLPRPVEAYGTGNTAEVVRWAMSQRGKPYIWASAGPRGFDCSGLVVASYRQIGITLPHQTTPLAKRGRAVSRADLRPGDLVFPSRSHVGIYIGDGQMVHAPKRGDVVKVAPVRSIVYARRIVG